MAADTPVTGLTDEQRALRLRLSLLSDSNSRDAVSLIDALDARCREQGDRIGAMGLVMRASADSVDREAAIASRSGQTARLEEIAAELRALSGTVHEGGDDG